MSLAPSDFYILIPNILTLFVLSVTELGMRSFADSLFDRTHIGSLGIQVPPHLGTETDAQRGRADHVKELRRSLVLDFSYVLDMGAAYLVFFISALGALVMENIIARTVYLAACLFALALWRFHAEAVSVKEYYEKRMVGCLTWHRIRIVFALLLSTSGGVDLLLRHFAASLGQRP